MAQGDFMERLLGGSKTQPSTYSATPQAKAMPDAGTFDAWSPSGTQDPNSLAGATGNEDYWSPVDKMAGQTGNEDYWSPIYKSQDGSYKANESQGEKPPNDDVDFDWDALFATYKSMGIDVGGGSGKSGGAGAGAGAGSGGIGGGGGGGDDTWRNGSPGSNRSGSSGGGGNVIYQGPVYDYPEYNKQEPFEYGATLDLPDYEPPEYDEGKERAVREEFIQTSKGAVSEATQKAILGSANVNNPQARGQIIKAALEGFGESLGKTALAGSEAGRRAAEKQQATETGIYQVKFQIESKEKIAKYDSDMKAELLNWELGNRQADIEYSQQVNQWNSMPNDKKAETYPGYNKTAGPPNGRRYI